MANIYFPGCNYIKHSPNNSRSIAHYLQEKYDMPIARCCAIDYKNLTAEDTAIYVCPTCSGILSESSPAKCLSIWELLVEDDQFPWPDYHGEKITLQDCWRTHDNRGMQDAVRTILRRMNVEIVEMGMSREKANFCGTSLLKKQSPRYKKLAPKRFIENAGDNFIPHSKEEQENRMKEHCSQFETEKVVCYCTGCLKGLKLGGANGVHLMDLVVDSLAPKS